MMRYGMTLLCAIGLTLGAVRAQADSYIYRFAVDPAQSSLASQFQLPGTTPGNDTTSYQGTMRAWLTPPTGAFSDIRVTNLALAPTSQLHLEWSPLFLTNVTVDTTDFAILLDATHGAAGAAATVDNDGAFAQTGNQLAFAGSVHWAVSSLFGSDSGDVDLTQHTLPADVAGTVIDDGTRVTLSLLVQDLVYEEPIEVLGSPQTLTVTVNGTIVGLADTIGIQGDADDGGQVDSADLGVWQRNYDPLGLRQNTFALGDWDGNGAIDSADLGLWQRNYNPLGLTEVVPEPATLMLLAGGLLLVSRRNMR